MTPEEMEIQALRREVKRLQNRNRYLEERHQQDIAQMSWQRRQVDVFMEGRNNDEQKT